MICLIKISGILLLLSFSFCSRPPLLNFDQIHAVTISLLNRINPEKIRGAGIAYFKSHEKKYIGNADIEWTKEDTFHADFYSPIGTVVASISGNAKKAAFSYDEKTFSQSLNSIMDSLPFAWGKCFTFNQFVKLLTGNITFLDSTIKTTPDSLVNFNRFSSVMWNLHSGEFSVTASINRRRALVEKITLNSNNPKIDWVIVCKNFDNGIAHSILFKENDDNYFSVEYDRLKYF